MIQTLVAVLMWLLVASLLFLRRKRAERNVTYAALAIAIAMTLNVDSIYIAADTVLGATNIATLLADSALMIGLFFLARGIMKAEKDHQTLVRIALSFPVLPVALAGILVTFLFIHRGPTTTTFMINLGDQPAAAAYSMIEFTYCGIVVAAMAALTARQYRLKERTQRIPAALLFLGSIFAITLCAVVVTMDIAHVAGNLRLLDTVAEAYGLLYLLTFIFLCAGLAAQPAIRYARKRVRVTKTDALVKQLGPMWRRATLVRPSLSPTDTPAASAADPERRLHRAIVEIRDAMIDPRVEFEMTRPDRALLEQAEEHLLGVAARDAHAAKPSSNRRESERRRA